MFHVFTGSGQLRCIKSQELEKFKAEQSHENQPLKQQIADLAKDKEALEERNKSLQEKNKSITKKHKDRFLILLSLCFEAVEQSSLHHLWLLIVLIFTQSSKS